MRRFPFVGLRAFSLSIGCWRTTVRSLALRVEVEEAGLVGVGGSVAFVSRAFVVIVDGRTGRLTLPKMGWFMAKVAGGGVSFGPSGWPAINHSLSRNAIRVRTGRSMVLEVPHLAAGMRSSTAVTCPSAASAWRKAHMRGDGGLPTG